MKITELKINGVENPIGFSYKKVLCSWKVTDTSAKKQKYARVEVAKTDDFTEIICRKKGEYLACNETEIEFEQEPCTRYYWRVYVEGENGEAATSEPAFFETAKMQMPWTGKWIGAAKEDTFHPVLKKEFSSAGKIKKARLYICGLGLYEAYLNGRKIGNDYLAPFLNDYIEAYQYQTYDVTELLKQENCFEILLGKGWYMGTFGLKNKEKQYGDRMMMIAELHLFYEDGSSQVIATDDSFKYRESYIEESGIYYGEDIDLLQWKEAENSWKNVDIIDNTVKLVERYSMPVVVKEKLTPVEILHTPAGETVVDFGQNHAGYMEFLADFKPGTKIVIECGEILQNGNFYHENYREARAAFTFISDGKKQVVRPHFTYFGYRYLKVTGWQGELKKEDIWSNVVYSDLKRTGYIETSNEKINRLYQNCLWSQKSNFIDLPTDCPQRSERLGWTGDAQVFSATASYNMDTRAFYRKFLTDLRSEQLRANGAVPNYIPSYGDFGTTSVWGDVATFLPWQLYQSYGNAKELESYYPLMCGWVSYMYEKDEASGGTRLFCNGFQFGDWLALDGVTEQSFKGSTEDDYIGSAYYYQSVKITSEAAEVLGLKEDADKYARLAEEIKSAIQREYFTSSGRLAMDTQAGYIIALHFKLYKDKEKLIEQFKERLKKDCYEIRCGFVGAPLLCMTLCENGMTDLAYHFLFQESFPSWLYCVNLGATTIWERWNSLLSDGTCSGTGMNSFNHYAYGSVVEFMYAYIGGIRRTEPGYKKALIAPQPDMKFRYFNCTYHSVSGMYVSNWKINEDGTFEMHIEIPFDCEAEVRLPSYGGTKVKGAEGFDISEGGSLVLSAGTYDFVYMTKKDFRLIYSAETRLFEVAGDEEVLSLLSEELPVAYGIIMEKDKENMNLSFGELGHMFFMGFDPETTERVTNKIYQIKRW